MRKTGNHGLGDQLLGFLTLLAFALIGLASCYWIGYGLIYLKRLLA